MDNLSEDVKKRLAGIEGDMAGIVMEIKTKILELETKEKRWADCEAKVNKCFEDLPKVIVFNVGM